MQLASPDKLEGRLAWQSVHQDRLPGLRLSDGPSVVASETNTKLRLFCWTADSVVTQTQREGTGWPVDGKEILGTESTTIIRLGSYSDVTCLLPVDCYYLEVMASSM